MKKVLILSGGYPNYGGEANTAYNLLILLKNNGFYSRAVYINALKDAETDPEQTGLSYTLYVSKRNIIHAVYNWLRRRVKWLKGRNLNNCIYSLRLGWKLLFLLTVKGFRPDIIIASHPIYFWISVLLFGKEKVLVIVGGCPEMIQVANVHMDALSVMNNPEIVGNENRLSNDFAYSKMKVLFNSELTRQIHLTLNDKPKVSFVQYFNITPPVLQDIKTFSSRDIDIAFVASNFDRNIKNAALAHKVFSALPEQNKVAIGQNSYSFSAIKNTSVSGLVSQKEILTVLSNSKLLIITSYFDASPGVLSEAIANGCNVLVSKNVGWHEMLDEKCIINNYNDVDEWVAKAQYLMANEIDYSQLKQVISNSQQEIINRINSL